MSIFKTVKFIPKSCLSFAGSLLRQTSAKYPTIHQATMATQSQEKPVEISIKQKLKNAFKPTFLEVMNESYMHSVPKGSETHFKVVVISDQFEGRALLKRHRMVNEILQTELDSGVHALSIVAKTPSQWDNSNQNIAKSPPCLGGAGL